MAKFRPYLAEFRDNSLPKYAASADNFKSHLQPMFTNIDKCFASIKTRKMQYKFCSAECMQSMQCSKKCSDFITKRLNETLHIPNDLSNLDDIFEIIENGEDPDTVVLVGVCQFACTGLVLGTFSKYFGRLRGRTEVDLRPSPVAAETFDWIYKWMLQPDGNVIKPELVMPLVQAAYYLEIPNLIQECYILLDNAFFMEFEAFGILHQLRQFYELAFISQAMVSRISSSIMIIMCSRQFLELTVEQICHLLGSNALAVNSETELLFGFMHWLHESWPRRANHVLRVFKMIRFAYLSPQLLVQLNGSAHNQMGPFKDILNTFSKLPESKQLVGDGIFYSTLVITMGGDPHQLKCIPSAKLDLMTPRRWMRDTRCKYHCPVTRLVPNMRYINYGDFVDYSQILQDSDKDYESYLEFPKYDTTNEAEMQKIYLSTSESGTDISETSTISPSMKEFSLSSNTSLTPTSSVVSSPSK